MERIIYFLKSVAEISTHTKVIILAIITIMIGVNEYKNAVSVQYNNINVSGMWYNAVTGGRSQFVQNGTVITFENFSASGEKVGYGNGIVINNRLELSGVENSQGYNSNFTVKFYLSNYNQRLSGTITFLNFGQSFPLNLTKR